MSFVVDWDGKDYDIDPNEFTGLELSEIKLRTTWSYSQLLRAISEIEPDAYRVLFWIVDKRDNQELKFSEYPGPPARVYLTSYSEFCNTITEPMGKGRKKAETPTTETIGGPNSSPNSDTSPGPNIEL